MRNSCKEIKYIFIFLLIMIIVGVIYIKSSNILHIVDEIYSPNKNIKLVVYVNKDDDKEDSVDIKIYDNAGISHSSISFLGQYGGIFWANDSSKYVIKVKDYISNIYVVDGISGEIIGVDFNLDYALKTKINDDSNKFNFVIDEKLNADYEFIKWENDNETMLIYYEIDDLDKNVHSGYLLYDYKNDKIYGMLSSTE